MSYQICADVSTFADENLLGKPELVEATSEKGTEHTIMFSVPGVIGREKEQTKALCTSLIEAGFLEFRISHSY